MPETARLVADLAKARSDRDSLDDARSQADAAHRAAEKAFVRFEKVSEEHGKEAADLQQRIARTSERLAEVEKQLPGARHTYTEKTRMAEKARSSVEHAQGEVRRLAPGADQTLSALRALIQFEDVAEAVLAGVEPAEGASLIDQIQQITGPMTTRAFNTVSQAYENSRASLSGLWHLDLGDPFEVAEQGVFLQTYRATRDGRSYTPSAAAVVAGRTREEARQRLAEHEQAALYDFIVGRLPAAIRLAWTEQSDWVKAANDKMKRTAASSGLHVSVKLTPRDDLAPDQKIVHDLAVKQTIATRTEDQNRELSAALTRLLAASDGATTFERVMDAVDVRRWVRIDYSIQRRGKDKPERWTRRTGLSTGERRLVTLAPMLAAVAAAYDALPSATTLRLAALDEVPAEVDEEGRAGLAGYISTLDLDLICTSHGWDGAPGAWDGIDLCDLESGPSGGVVGFPLSVRAAGVSYPADAGWLS